MFVRLSNINMFELFDNYEPCKYEYKYKNALSERLNNFKCLPPTYSQRPVWKCENGSRERTQ